MPWPYPRPNKSDTLKVGVGSTWISVFYKSPQDINVQTELRPTNLQPCFSNINMCRSHENLCKMQILSHKIWSGSKIVHI